MLVHHVALGLRHLERRARAGRWPWQTPTPSGVRENRVASDAVVLVTLFSMRPLGIGFHGHHRSRARSR